MPASLSLACQCMPQQISLPLPSLQLFSSLLGFSQLPHPPSLTACLSTWVGLLTFSPVSLIQLQPCVLSPLSILSIHITLFFMSSEKSFFKKEGRKEGRRGERRGVRSANTKLYLTGILKTFHLKEDSQPCLMTLLSQSNYSASLDFSRHLKLFFRK